MFNRCRKTPEYKKYFRFIKVKKSLSYVHRCTKVQENAAGARFCITFYIIFIMYILCKKGAPKCTLGSCTFAGSFFIPDCSQKPHYAGGL